MSATAAMLDLDREDREVVAKDSLSDVLGPGNYRRLARQTGVDRGHIARTLRGQAPRVSFEVVSRIALAAGVSLEDLKQFISQARGASNGSNQAT